MASPQKEHGYTMIANELMEALAKTRIAGEARQTLDTIIRKTYGFNKKEDAISLSQFSAITKLRKPTVVRALRKLLSMNIITKKDNDIANIYSFNKDFDSWEPLSKKIMINTRKSSLKPFCYICGFDEALEKHHISRMSKGGKDLNSNKIVLCPNCHTLVHKGKYSEKFLIDKKDNTENVIKKDNPSLKNELSKKIHTKDTLTKDTIQKKEICASSFEEIWKKYPNRVGKKEAERHFKASVKTPKDREDISQALKHYLESERVAKGILQNGSTWFNNWRDWIEYTEPICSKCKGKGRYSSLTGYRITCDCPAGMKLKESFNDKV
ncbi:MAG TPA: hypothetical protein ENH85_12610 [Candidatus Scalindua sp.]|nr:hypothetical protein [Candidatus Scalindua sp.]